MKTKFGEGRYAEVVTEIPLIERYVDATADDSDKSFSPPANETWKLNSVFVKMVTSAVVGNRQICIEVSSPAGVVIGRISAGAVQAASTTRYYLCMQGTFRETAFINEDIQIPIPMDSYIVPGAALRVYDSAAIDATHDDMTVSYSVKRYIGVY